VIAWAGFTASSFVAASVTLAVAIGFGAWGGRFGSRARRTNDGAKKAETAEPRD
jgi:hypothetical protein